MFRGLAILTPHLCIEQFSTLVGLYYLMNIMTSEKQDGLSRQDAMLAASVIFG